MPSNSINIVTEEKKYFNFQSICLSSKLIKQQAGRTPCLTQTSWSCCSWMRNSAQITHIFLVSHHRTVMPLDPNTPPGVNGQQLVSHCIKTLLILEAAHRDQLCTLWTVQHGHLCLVITDFITGTHGTLKLWLALFRV